MLRPPPRGGRTPPGRLVIPPWSFSLGGTLSAAQAAYNNWTEGGLNTLALTAGVDGKAERNSGAWTQTHEMRLALGFVKQDTLDVRKADDLVRLASAFQYEGDGFFQTFNPTLSATLRTQFAEGFNYDRVPKELQTPEGTRTPPVQVSSFLSPGVFTESLGLTAEPRAWLVQRLGIASKQTVVWERDVRPLYEFSADRAVRVQAGLSSTTEVNREVIEDVRLRSSLGLFTAFNQASNTPDVTWENVVTAKLNRYLSINFEFTTLYDPNISPDPQIKQSLSLGVRVVMI